MQIFDAIVVGSGITGGLAAKELCEKGLKTLVLERGRQVEHIKDYPTANLSPWEFPHGLRHTSKQLNDNPVQSFGGDASTTHFFASDQEHPYIQNDPFNWVRGYQVSDLPPTWYPRTQLKGSF